MAAAGPSLFCPGTMDHNMGTIPSFLGTDLETVSQLTGMTNSNRIMRLDNFTFRIRKGTVSAESGTKKGPMIAKHPQALAPSPTLISPGLAEQVTEMMKVAPPPLRCRTPPPIPGPGTADGFRPRKRSPSITRSRPSSPGNGSNRRPASPGALEPAVLEAVRRRVRRVSQARLYLLQQPGPNSFLVGGDSPEHKYRVVIGPQTCSCGRGPHCLHLLFVMLRVFQVPESDSRIYSKELKNFEVESLFHNYQERRNLRVNGSPDFVRKDCPMTNVTLNSSLTTKLEGSSRIVADSTSTIDAKPVEEELCPICLLEMVDGESLVTCTTGCRNKLHHHCMAIWAVECQQQSELVLCPLCRRPWHDDTRSTYNSLEQSRSPLLCRRLASPTSYYPLPGSVSPQGPRKCMSRVNQPSSSGPRLVKKSYPSTCKKYGVTPPSPGSTSPSLSYRSFPTTYKSNNSHLVQDVLLPHSGAIPSEQMGIASEWIKVFGTDVVSCLYSRDWKAREMALRRLVNDIVTVHQSDNREQQQKVIWCCAKILTMVAADPVFKVYLGCVRCFRVLLSYASCHDQAGVSKLRDLIRPIVQTLLSKCADRNRRTSHLSTEVLVELVKGQSGELALGRNSSVAMAGEVSTGLEGLELVLGCVLEDWYIETTSWQWLAGRLIVLDRFIRDFPNEFGLQYVPLYPNESGYKLRNYNRLITIVEFALKALRSTHVTVSKLARHVFVVSAAMTGVERGVFSQVLDMLAGLDPALQARLKKRLQSAADSQPITTPAMTVRHPPKAGRVVASLNQPGITERRYSKVEVRPYCTSCGRTGDQNKNAALLTNGSVKCVPISAPVHPTTPAVRLRDLPLDKGRSKKTVKCQQLPGISSTTPPPQTKLWGASGSRLYNLFTRNKKPEDVLPSKPELCQAPAPKYNNSADINPMCSMNEPLSGLLSRWMTPTSPISSPTTPVQEALPDFPDDCKVELIIPLCLRELNNPSERDLSTIPGLQSAIEPHHVDVHSQDQNMESGIKYDSYLEDIDWKRGHILGTGAFSTCYQARDTHTGTLMAVKQVPFRRNLPKDQENVESGIRDEIVTMSKLRHTNIVRILGATKQGTHYNMFVEWMAGGSIANMLDKYGPFNDQVIVLYSKQILDGLSYLHDNYILHRDLKGANLLVDSTGQHLRIADFGVSARLVSQATVSGEFKHQQPGTVAFMAPEVVRGEHYGRSCDIWSVGCCIIEMSSSKPPWKEVGISNHYALTYKIATSKNPPFIPESLSRATKDLALHCLRVNSKLRPSAKELLRHCCFQGLELRYPAQENEH